MNTTYYLLPLYSRFPVNYKQHEVVYLPKFDVELM